MGTFTTIDDPSQFFQVEVYTDADATTNDTTSQTFDGNADLQPDLLWFKSRTVTGNHGLLDTTRGKGGGTSFKTFFIQGGSTAAERTSSSGYDLTAMNSDGFSYGRPNQLDWAHDSPAKNVVWAWKINGGTTASNSASANNADVASVNQVNNTSGIAVGTYTGSGTSNHEVYTGLTGSVETAVVKNRDDANTNFQVVWPYYAFESSTRFLRLNSTDDGASVGGNSGEHQQGVVDVHPTTVNAGTINLTSGGAGFNDVNKSSTDYWYWAMKSIKGFSKIGGYTSNNNADGPYIYCGFQPAFVMIKEISDGGTSWRIYDNKRPGHNGGSQGHDYIKAQTTDQEIAHSTSEIHFTGHGFKLTGAEGDINYNELKMVYWAFAHHPLVTSTGIPTTGFGRIPGSVGS